MRHGLSILLLFVLLIVAMTTGSCSRKKKREKTTPHCLLPSDVQLKSGDVVFRRGEGLASQVVLASDRKGNYSHTGIVVDSCGTLLICHAVPGEPDFEGDPDRVKADSPEHFFSSVYATIGEVCRTSDSTAAAKAAQVAWKVYKRGTLFDHEYDDLDTTQMYCTELVVFAYRQAGYDLVEDRGHHINLPILQADCVFPSDIHASPLLTTLIQF